MRLILNVLASLAVAVVSFVVSMFLAIVLTGIIWPQSGERNLGLGMLLLTVGVPISLLLGAAGGILTFRKLRNKGWRNRSELK
jgi:asparagine N-glycosylation enzyme membrane subunit Stt3